MVAPNYHDRVVSDPAENVNIADHPENVKLVKQLSMQLDAGWRKALPASD